MSDQDAHALIRLNHAVKVAEGDSERRDYGSSPRETEAQITEEGFPRFKDLPPEIRSKIWQDAMPSYGIYTVLMLGRQEPMPQQPPPPAPVVFRTVYRLEPVPRDQQGDELRTRLDTMQAIQGVSSEAAHEVERTFPTTIDCTGGKLRFNAMNDSLNLSDLHCLLRNGFIQRFARYTQGAVVFANDWHKVPRTMLFNNRALWDPFIGRALDSDAKTHVRHMKGFLVFLSECTNLETVGLTYDVPLVDFSRLLDYSLSSQRPLSLLTPVMRGLFYQPTRYASAHVARPQQFTDAAQRVKALLKYAFDPAREVPEYLQPGTSRPSTLQHLQFQTVVPVSPVLHDEVRMLLDKHGL